MYISMKYVILYAAAGAATGAATGRPLQQGPAGAGSTAPRIAKHRPGVAAALRRGGTQARVCAERAAALVVGCVRPPAAHIRRPLPPPPADRCMCDPAPLPVPSGDARCSGVLAALHSAAQDWTGSGRPAARRGAQGRQAAEATGGVPPLSAVAAAQAARLLLQATAAPRATCTSGTGLHDAPEPWANRRSHRRHRAQS